MLAYGQSKTANVLFAVELDRRWADDQLGAMGILDESGQPIIDSRRGLKTPDQAASTSVFAAISPRLAAVGGVYLKDNDVAPLDDGPSLTGFGSEPINLTGVAPHAVNPDSAQRLWELSTQLLTA